MEIKLSDRMQMVADMVSGDTVADIGCDHAFVSIYLVSKGICKRAIAMDLREGPLDGARDNINERKLTDKIDIRLSNGFEKLNENEADCAVIAGMGGMLMTEILEKGKIHLDNGIRLVLQPQSDIDVVRRYLMEHFYNIIEEQMLVEEGKYYTAICAIRQDNIINYSLQELLFGPKLIENKSSCLKEYLRRKKSKNIELLDRLDKTGTEKSSVRKQELKEEQQVIEDTLKLL